VCVCESGIESVCEREKVCVCVRERVIVRVCERERMRVWTRSNSSSRSIASASASGRCILRDTRGRE
jgi:hypothetical protein